MTTWPNHKPMCNALVGPSGAAGICTCGETWSPTERWLRDRIAVLEAQVQSLQMAAPRGIPKEATPMPSQEGWRRGNQRWPRGESADYDLGFDDGCRGSSEAGMCGEIGGPNRVACLFPIDHVGPCGGFDAAADGSGEAKLRADRERACAALATLIACINVAERRGWHHIQIDAVNAARDAAAKELWALDEPTTPVSSPDGGK